MSSGQKRKFIMVYWKCCHVYSRVYKNKEGSHYKGMCPKCRAPVTAAVGAEGTHQRMFFAG